MEFTVSLPGVRALPSDLFEGNDTAACHSHKGTRNPQDANC